MRVYWSTGAFRQPTLAHIIEFSLAHGICHIELSSGVEYQPDLLDPVRASLGDIHYLVHNYFPPPADPFVLNLAASDRQMLQRSLDLCRTAIDLSAELGAPFYSVHSGFAFRLTPDLLGDPVAQSRVPKSEQIPYEVAYGIFAESVATLADYASSKGLRLLIENNVVSPLYLQRHGENALLMASAVEIDRFMQDMGHPALGILVDTGHVKVTSAVCGFQREKFLETLAPYIGAFHLSDNDGVRDQNLPFDEGAWFCAFLRDFPGIPVVVEAYGLSWEQMQHQSRVLEAVLT